MNRLGRLARRARDDDRGAGYLAAYVVLFGTLTVAGVGVLVDSARIMTAERHASAVAFEAARAGAQAIDVSTARAGNGTIDAGAARTEAHRAAGALLAGTGATVTGVEVTGSEVVVTVVRRVEPWFPMVPARTVNETGRARILEGADAP
jgi:Tfp pilus assembly protein PilX